MLGKKGGGNLSDAVLVALIGLGGSCLGSIIGVIASGKLTQYRIEQLEKKVDKHNNLVERTYKLEENEKVLEEKIKVANHRIEDLEEAARDG